MARRWGQDPQYTHGYVVPLFAAVVLWFRRDWYPAAQLRGSWWGIALLVLATLQRLVGVLFSYEWVEAGSLLPAVAGVLLLTGGWPLLRWAWPVLAFLLFVLPWPWQFDMALTYPLRRVATVSSTYALQTLGFPALARGNVITVNDLEVGVIEACSGLGMLMAFFALSTAVALIIERPWLDRVVLFLSAIPVGVLMNIVRITVTVALFTLVSAEAAKFVFHDIAGWVMMPLALGVMGLELVWLDRLRLPAEDSPGTAPTTVPIAPRSEGANRSTLETPDAAS